MVQCPDINSSAISHMLHTNIYARKITIYKKIKMMLHTRIHTHTHTHQTKPNQTKPNQTKQQQQQQQQQKQAYTFF